MISCVSGSAQAHGARLDGARRTDLRKPTETVVTHTPCGVRKRCTYRGLDDFDAFACEDGIELARVLAVSVADQETEARRPLLKCPGELAGLLSDPCCGWAGGATREVDAAAAELG
jgi:hypothetical protein